MKKPARLPGWFIRLLSFVPILNLIAIIYLGVVSKHVITLVFGIIYLISFFASTDVAATLSLIAIPYYFFAYRYLKKKIGKSDPIDSDEGKNEGVPPSDFQENDRNLSEIQALKEEINTLKIALGEVEVKLRDENTSMKGKNEEYLSNPESELSVNGVNLSLTDDVETESQPISPVKTQKNDKLVETFIQANKPLSYSSEVSKHRKLSQSEDADLGGDDLNFKKSNAEVESSSYMDQKKTFTEENFDNKLTDIESNQKQSNILSKEEKIKPGSFEEFKQRNETSLVEGGTSEKLVKTEPAVSLSQSIKDKNPLYFDAIRMAEALVDEPALEWQTKGSELMTTQPQSKEERMGKSSVDIEDRTNDVITQEPFIVGDLNQDLDEDVNEESDEKLNEGNQPQKSELADKNINLMPQLFKENSTNTENQPDHTDNAEFNSYEKRNNSSFEVSNDITALTPSNSESQMFNVEAKNQSLNSNSEKIKQEPLHRREPFTNNSMNTNPFTEKIGGFHWDAETPEKSGKALGWEKSNSGLKEFHKNTSTDFYERKKTLKLDLATIRSLRDESEAVREALLVEQEESKAPLTDLRDMSKVYQTLSHEAKTFFKNLHKSNWRVPLEMRNEKIVNEINRQSEYLAAKSILIVSRGWVSLEDDFRDEFQEILLDDTIESKKLEVDSTGKNGSIFDLQYLSQPLKSLIEQLGGTGQETVRIILESNDIEKDLGNFAEQNLSMPETLIDSVNEKAMFLIEDILIDTSGVPQILEEYDESLRNSLDRSK